ncbi:macrophage mannose receptor 1-like [Tachysurus fulvidraco]|uniref:macrophage mannose receptor 1-like n=1 Tax=Tachysurus fulvidraco TaxID=1234273 RepID=UPI000F4EEB27|nr:macrophage mannose receptor 1-like [Tachysurus fulvidraco]
MNSWIGLRKNKGETSFTQWSDGSVLGFSKWKSGQPDNLQQEDCVLMSSEWENQDCSNLYNFFCYTWVPQLIVVQEKKNWEEALVYCRMQYTDLVSLTSATDHFLVNSKSMEFWTPTFWTSLRFMDGSWFWVNDNSLPRPTSLPSRPAKPFRCGARNIATSIWENRDCEEKMNFICYHST